MRIFMRRLGRFVVLAAGLFAAATGVGGQAQPGSAASTNGTRGARPYTTWTAYGGGGDSSQYSALNQVNKSNVSQLQVVWTFPVTGTVIFNPLVVDGVMYLQASGNALAAVDAATGKEIWRRQTQGMIGARGMNYWESPDRSDRRFIYLQRGDVIAVNAQNGEAITSFGNNGRVDLREAMERKPAGNIGTSNPGRIFESSLRPHEPRRRTHARES
jgi:quinoprotein glucose dehydrogenase